ncbi:RNA methyltransferase [Clostridium sp. OM05-9BH]|uniref:RNA methyltransferase n=1 Tax=unclassified Clostridium TaxID=2614128 RepID=UPI00325B0526
MELQMKGFSYVVLRQRMQVKRMCGLDMGENYNRSKKENPEVKQCPQEKVEYIKDALRHFKLI